MVHVAVIVAGGTGRRFGGLKQFALLGGRTVLERAIAPFEQCAAIDQIILVAPPSHMARTRRLVRNAGFRKIRTIVEGGRRRQDSVMRGVSMITARTGIVAIHDGARPLVSPRLIVQGIRLAGRYGVVVFGRPVSETLKYVEGHRVIRTVPRDGLWLVQTPQFFRLCLLQRAYADVDFRTDYTDEAALVEKAGIRTFLYPGDRNNLKITDPTDLERARLFVG